MTNPLFWIDGCSSSRVVRVFQHAKTYKQEKMCRVIIVNFLFFAIVWDLVDDVVWNFGNRAFAVLVHIYFIMEMWLPNMKRQGSQHIFGSEKTSRFIIMPILRPKHIPGVGSGMYSENYTSADESVCVAVVRLFARLIRRASFISLYYCE
jgi:hypothetical protein